MFSEALLRMCPKPTAWPSSRVHTAQDHSIPVTSLAWIGSCAFAVVSALTLPLRAETGTLSQAIIPYHSLECAPTAGGKDRERESEREKVGEMKQMRARGGEEPISSSEE